MSKDPAFLFYYRDFDHGTRYMKLEAIGAYIKCLCEQADKGINGTITPEHMYIICRSSDAIMSEVCSKFVKDKDGNYHNLRLREELKKRHEYAESRRRNRAEGHKKKKEKEANISTSYDSHMANASANGNADANAVGNGNEKANANEAENGSGLIYQMHQLWLAAWPDYIPDDIKDITALRSISIKLKRLVEKKNKGSGEIRAATDGEVVNAFEYIITNYPKWYRDNLISLSGLNSKFNDLIATLQKKTEHDEQSAKDLAYILSTDY